jgi:hypothetical protein
VGSSKLDGDQTETRVHKCLPRFGSPEGYNLCPACLTLLQWCLQRGVYNSGVDLPPNLLYAKVGSQDCSPS